MSEIAFLNLNVFNTVMDLVMIAPTQLQIAPFIFSYTILANPKVEPHAPKGYSILDPEGGAEWKNNYNIATSL